jgi:hypothetical protein
MFRLEGIETRRWTLATEETKAEADVKIADVKAMDEGERVVTLKIDLRGPSEFVSWMRDMRDFNPLPFRIGMFPRLSTLLPPAAREHMRNARREQILAVRSVVDSVLDAMINRLEHAGEKSERKATKVDVD